ncbi:MAG: class I SAM-dependent methyltransferase [Opitutaceae bacterium]|nr:class I SAM-dependent methyltransferase [Opitutaceae bacterium]
MTTSQPSFRNWIENLPKWHGLVRISPERAYAHAEDQYDAQYGVSAREPEEGQGLCALLQQNQVDTTGPALEIGCGTGRLTYGLAHHYPGSDFVATDPSPAFLRLTASQFPDGPAGPARLHFALLNADDLGQLPPDMFSLIAMRSTLHHILEVEPFIAACARTLRPGGALAMGAEPLESGYLLMAAVAQSIGPTLKAAGIALTPRWRRQLDDFTATVKFYCRRDLVKDTAEDKHLFTTHELADLGRRHGLQLRYFPNATFSDYAPPFAPEFEGFSVFFLNYLQFCMQFDADFMDLIREHLRDQLKYFDECYSSHPGPAITGVFLFQKDARS